MQYFTFENVIGLALVIFAFFNLSNTFKRTSQLGALQKKTLNGIRYTDFSQLILILLALAAWCVAFFSSKVDSTMIIFFISFVIAIVVFLISAVYIIFKPSGFYENGIATGATCIMYSEITVYKTIDSKDGSTMRVVFNPKGKFFSNSIRICVNKEDAAETKDYLKKHCKFRKK